MLNYFLEHLCKKLFSSSKVRIDKEDKLAFAFSEGVHKQKMGLLWTSVILNASQLDASTSSFRCVLLKCRCIVLPLSLLGAVLQCLVL